MTLPDNLDFERLLKDLRRDEGYRAHPYLCSAGVLTIGYGATTDFDGSPIKEGIVWLPKQANKKLEIDAKDAIKDVLRAFPWCDVLEEPAMRGLVNMAYNLGLTRLSKFKRMLSALKFTFYEHAAREALDSKWASQVGHRATRIAEQFRSCANV